MTFYFKSMLAFVLQLSLCAVLSAQVDTVALDLVEVASTRTNIANTGGVNARWDSTALTTMNTTNLADLLQRSSGVFVKSYGLGSIATTSIRGASSAHTSVIWNGFKLNSPMLGLLDLSLIPVGTADDVAVYYGGNTSLWGNASIGGVVSVNSRSRFGKNLSIENQTTFGSFGKLDEQLNFSFGDKKWNSRTKLNWQEAQNDFPFQINEDLPVELTSNAALKRKTLMQDLFFKINSNQQLAIHFWWQDMERQIPPRTAQNFSNAFQKDKLFRLALNWKKQNENSVLQGRLGYFTEQIDYENPQILFRALTVFHTVIAELEQQFYFKNNQTLHIGINETYNEAVADAYLENPKEINSAIFAAYRKTVGNWNFQLNARQSLVNDQLQPFVPSIGVENDLSKNIKIKAKVSRNYRLPTFNDRFWRPGGNEELLPERGWSEELTLQWAAKQQKNKIGFGVTAFNRNISNWIRWLLVEGETSVSANNISKVWSRGLEHRFNYHLAKDNWQVGLNLGYDYILSTNQLAISKLRIEAGDQLDYVPKHQAFAKLDFRVSDFQFSYQHTYTGGITTIQDPLPGYSLAFISTQYNFKIKKLTTGLFLNVNNLFDKSYRAVERRPMPGRNFDLGIRLKFN